MTPEEMDELADALDARCAALGEGAGAWVNAIYLEVIGCIPNPPDWLAAARSTLTADWDGERKAINDLAGRIVRNLEREDGERITTVIGGQTLQIHPYLVLGRSESDRQMLIAHILQFVTSGDGWDWDLACEVYRWMCDLDAAEATLEVFCEAAKQPKL